jgi:hypothetical protein
VRSRIALACVLALGVTGCMAHHGGEEKEGAEGKEVKVTLDQVPPAAKATLLKEANGNPIPSVDKEEMNGKTVYEADVKMNGTNWEIVVAQDGKLISKKVDNEDNEKKAQKMEIEEEDDKK